MVHGQLLQVSQQYALNTARGPRRRRQMFEVVNSALPCGLHGRDGESPLRRSPREAIDSPRRIRPMVGHRSCAPSRWTTLWTSAIDSADHQRWWAMRLECR